MRAWLYGLIFASLIAESEEMFAKHWRTPLRFLFTALFEFRPLVLPLLDLMLLGMLVLASERGPAPRSRALERTVGVSVLAMAAWSVWGISRGGLFYQVQFQLHAWLVALLWALVIKKVLYLPEHFVTLAKVVIYAALVRGLMCIAFYLLVVRKGVLDPIPEFITTHDDTVLFVSAAVAVIINVVNDPVSRHWKTAFLVGVPMLLAIQFNNRRLAWVSLAGSVLLAYAMLPRGGLKHRVNRLVLGLAPLCALYVALGWGRPEAVFKPLRAFHTVSGQKDPSTRSRDAENQGLLVTLTRHPSMGTGFGHEYVEVDDTLSAGRSFVQYRYLPHNSVLGILAFAGLFGFAAIWMVFPVAAFLAAHVYRHASRVLVRSIALMCLCEVLICLSQWWGDMGMISPTTGLLMAAAFAAAARMTNYAA
jgi:hypothetical protein